MTETGSVNEGGLQAILLIAVDCLLCLIQKLTRFQAYRLLRDIIPLSAIAVELRFCAH
jgi:hypothetical protein